MDFGGGAVLSYEKQQLTELSLSLTSLKDTVCLLFEKRQALWSESTVGMLATFSLSLCFLTYQGLLQAQ